MHIWNEDNTTKMPLILAIRQMKELYMQTVCYVCVCVCLMGLYVRNSLNHILKCVMNAKK